MAITADDLEGLTDDKRQDWLRAKIAEMQREQRQHQTPRAEAVTGKTDASWLDRASGIFANSPLFEEAVRSGLEWRNVDRPADEAE